MFFFIFLIIIGVVANVLLGRFSPRLLCMVGGLTGSVCLMMCSAVRTNIDLAVFLFGSGKVLFCLLLCISHTFAYLACALLRIYGKPF